MTSGQQPNQGDRPEDSVGFIQFIQLVPSKPDKKVSRWERLAAIFARVIRSRFGLRSAELVDRYAEAKVAELEGEAKIKHAKAIKILGDAAVMFAQAKAVRTHALERADDPETRDWKPEDRDESVNAAFDELKAAVAILEQRGATVELHVAAGDSSLPKLAD